MNTHNSESGDTHSFDFIISMHVRIKRRDPTNCDLYFIISMHVWKKSWGSNRDLEECRSNNWLLTTLTMKLTILTIGNFTQNGKISEMGKFFFVQ